MSYANFLTQTADILRGTIESNAEGDPRERWTVIAENIRCCLQLESSGEPADRLKAREERQARFFLEYERNGVHVGGVNVCVGDILCVYQEDLTQEVWRITQIKKVKSFGKSIAEGNVVYLYKGE